MIVILAMVACGEKDIEDTSVYPEPSNEDTSTEEVLPPFVPTAGHWTYSGGTLIDAGTSCQLDTSTGGDLTDPVGFLLALTDGGFTMSADNSTDPASNCLLTDATSTSPGTYNCSSSSSQVWFQNVWEDDFGNDMSILMQINTDIMGSFTSASTLNNIFTLTLQCIDVDYDNPFASVSCSDVNAQYPTPCTIQFSAAAALDQ